MQDDRGFKRLLSISWVYGVFQDLVGMRRTRQWLAKNFWRLQGGERVVDVGCGPAAVRSYLPPSIEYVGLDVNERYIVAARQTFEKNSVFLVGSAGDILLASDPRLCGADLVMCTGILHHLNDEETLQVLELANRILRLGGRLVCFEPTYLMAQGRFSRWLIGRDRGRNVRTEQEWKAIVAKVFPDYSTNIVTGLILLPYIHIIIECRKSA